MINLYYLVFFKLLGFIHSFLPLFIWVREKKCASECVSVCVRVRERVYVEKRGKMLKWYLATPRSRWARQKLVRSKPIFCSIGSGVNQKLLVSIREKCVCVYVCVCEWVLVCIYVCVCLKTKESDVSKDRSWMVF